VTGIEGKRAFVSYQFHPATVYPNIGISLIFLHDYAQLYHHGRNN
jgi:hypothetical protein